MVTDCERKTKTAAINQGEASEMLAYLVRKHNKKSQRRKIRKLKTVMQDQKVCKKSNVRAEEKQITAARAKQHEDEEEDTGIMPEKQNKTCVLFIRAKRVSN